MERKDRHLGPSLARARANPPGAFLWKIKGEQFLTKLAAQEMLVGRNLRQLGEAVARGKVGALHRAFLLHILALHQGGSAGETAVRD